MASEHKLHSAEDNQSDISTNTSGEPRNPANDTNQPSCCTSDTGHKVEPHPSIALPEESTEQVEGAQVHGVVTGGQQEGGEGPEIEERKEKTTDKEVGEETFHQETTGHENKEEEHVGVLVSVEENDPPREVGASQGPQVTGEEKGPQVAVEELAPQLRVEETGPQVINEDTAPKITETQAETGESSAPQATTPETRQKLGSDQESSAQVTDTGAHQYSDAQVSAAGEKWVDMLVHTIVTEATGEGASTAAQVHAGVADAITVIIQEEEHSTMQVTGIETMTGEQVTLQGAPAQVNSDTQVSSDNTDITLHVSERDSGVETATPEQVHVEAGADRQVEEAAAHSAGAKVTKEEAQEDIRSSREAGGKLVASGEEADREVTPDLDALAGREGTVEPDQPVACREKEWPSLICTASEVRTVTEEQGDIQQGSVTPKETSDKTPEMKEREILEDEHSPTNETPIEREIRLTMEREMSLRQERGISSPIGEPELVEVRRKTISLQPAADPGKERQLAGAQMQREIQLETQREQDLVELGKVMGTYDRGPQQELQEKKMIFESMNTEPSEAPIKKKQSEPEQPIPQTVVLTNVPESNNHEVPAKEPKKGPSYAEAQGSNVIIIEHSALLRRSIPGNTINAATPADFSGSNTTDSRRSTPAEISRTNSSGSPLPTSADPPASPGSPYQMIRSPSPRSLLEREIEEVKERERELQRLRSSIYGRDQGVVETTQKSQEITPDVQSVYQPERPSWGKLEVNWPPNKEAEMNGQQQVSDSPRIRRQRSTLIQSWEAGNPNPRDDE